MQSSKGSEFELVVAPPSTWALRAWLTLKLCGVPFHLQNVSHDFLLDKPRMLQLSDTGLVPVLIHNGLKIHDSLAIAEYLHELFPNKQLYPGNRHLRAQARSLVAELHSGFTALRTQLPFFIGEPKSGLVDANGKNELRRLSECWANATLPFYFAEPGVVDAFYAVMAARLYRYQITVEASAEPYFQSLLRWNLLQEGLADQAGW